METSSPVIFLAVVLVAAVVLLVLLGNLKPKRKLDHALFRQRWQRIESLKNGNEAEWHLAVFEADKLLDEALKSRGFRGKTMGDRLKNARKNLAHNNDVWQAHKLRNRLAHEAGVTLHQSQVNNALHGFEAGLKDLGAL